MTKCNIDVAGIIRIPGWLERGNLICALFLFNISNLLRKFYKCLSSTYKFCDLAGSDKLIKSRKYGQPFERIKQYQRIADVSGKMFWGDVIEPAAEKKGFNPLSRIKADLTFTSIIRGSAKYSHNCSHSSRRLFPQWKFERAEVYSYSSQYHQETHKASEKHSTAEKLTIFVASQGYKPAQYRLGGGSLPEGWSRNVKRSVIWHLHVY